MVSVLVPAWALEKAEALVQASVLALEQTLAPENIVGRDKMGVKTQQRNASNHFKTIIERKTRTVPEEGTKVKVVTAKTLSTRAEDKTVLKTSAPVRAEDMLICQS
jgi:hypothetical protein